MAYKVKILSDIIIPSGTVMRIAPVRAERYVPFFEANVDFDEGDIMSIFIDSYTVEKFPDKFQVMESRPDMPGGD